jgi:hypothetical protein
MSYGRRPYYIYQGEYDTGEAYFCFMGGAEHEESGDQSWTRIEYDAMAQLVASMWWRDHNNLSEVHGELLALIQRGIELRNLTEKVPA